MILEVGFLKLKGLRRTATALFQICPRQNGRLPGQSLSNLDLQRTTRLETHFKCLQPLFMKSTRLWRSLVRGSKSGRDGRNCLVETHGCTICSSERLLDHSTATQFHPKY